MKIEISEEKYWKELNYYDGIMYCQLLDIGGKDDWRMVNNSREWYNVDFIYNFGHTDKWCASRWYIDDIDKANDRFLKNQTYMVIPVRDI